MSSAFLLLTNLYFNTTWFRHTCDCVAQVSGYQNVKSPKIYANWHLFNFSEECHFNTLSRLVNVLTASEFPYIFCSYKSERTKTKRCCKKWTVGKCIFQGAKFENCSFKSNCPVTEVALKSETSCRHQESHFLCWSQIIYWLQCSNNVIDLLQHGT